MAKNLHNKRVKMNPYALPNAEVLKRSFFKEAIYNGWSFHERSLVFNQCNGNSHDFHELLNILKQYIDFINDKYFEPDPIKNTIWHNEMDLISDDAEFYLYQYSLTEEFINTSKKITDKD